MQTKKTGVDLGLLHDCAFFWKNCDSLALCIREEKKEERNFSGEGVFRYRGTVERIRINKIEAAEWELESGIMYRWELGSR